MGVGILVWDSDNLWFNPRQPALTSSLGKENTSKSMGPDTRDTHTVGPLTQGALSVSGIQSVKR